MLYSKAWWIREKPLKVKIRHLLVIFLITATKYLREATSRGKDTLVLLSFDSVFSLSTVQQTTLCFSDLFSTDRSGHLLTFWGTMGGGEEGEAAVSVY